MRRAALSVIFILILTSGSEAGSPYGKFGIGELVNIKSARSHGMGGWNIALADEFTPSFWNPAQWTTLEDVRINLLTIVNGTGIEGKTSPKFTDFGGFGMSIPVGRRVAIGGGLYPITRSKYDLLNTGVTGGESWTLNVKGSGGMSAIGLGMAFEPNQNLSVGVKWDWVLGSREETWTTVFENRKISSAVTSNHTAFDGSILTIGFFHRGGIITVGASASIPMNVDMKREVFYSFTEDLNTPEEKFGFPGTGRFGLAYTKSAGWRTGLEFEYSDWEKLNDKFIGNFGNYYNISYGIEKMSSRGAERFIDKINWRAGLNIGSLYQKGYADESINEKALTFGIGIPFHNGMESLDLGISYGLRGADKPGMVKERILVIAVGYSAGEKWFRRRD